MSRRSEQAASSTSRSWLARVATVVSAAVVLGVLYRVFAGGHAQEPDLPAAGGPQVHAVTGATIGGWTRAASPLDLPRHEAMFWTPLPGGGVRCELCPHACELGEGETGRCLARINEGGRLYTLTYDHTGVRNGVMGGYEHPLTLAGFYGRRWIQVGLVGCPLRCAFCYLGDTAQMDPRDLVTRSFAPKRVVEEAVLAGNAPVLFSYNEPTNSFEYTLEVLRLAKERGLVTIVSSSGFVNPEPVRAMVPYTDGVALGIKAFTEEGYGRLTTGSLAPVLRAAEIFHDSGVAVEIHYLLVSGITDSPAELTALAAWVRDRLGNAVPIHVIRFRPTFKLASLPPTPLSAVATAIRTLREGGARYVFPYVSVYEDRAREAGLQEILPVRCPHCGAPIWDIGTEDGHPKVVTGLVEGHCGACGQPMPGLPMVIERHHVGPLP